MGGQGAHDDALGEQGVAHGYGIERVGQRNSPNRAVATNVGEQSGLLKVGEAVLEPGTDRRGPSQQVLVLLDLDRLEAATAPRGWPEYV